MRYKFQMLALLLGILGILTACGGNGASSAAPAVSSGEPEVFGAESVGGPPEQMAETTMLPEMESGVEPESSQESETSIGETVAAGPQDLTEQAVTSAILCDYQDQIPYDSTDPVFFWRAMAYLIDAVGDKSPALTVEGNLVRLQRDDLEPFVQALFGSYDEAYPSVTEEDPFVTSEMDGTAEIYTISVADLPRLEVTMTEPEAQGDGTYLAQAELTEDGQVQRTYTVTLVDSPEAGAETQLFAYSITDLQAE